MYELVSVSFQCFALAVAFIRRTAVFAAVVHPRVLDGAMTHVALGTIELRHAESPVGELAAVQAAARKQTRELGDRDAIKLFVHDVLDAFMQVGVHVLKPLDEALGRLR